MDKNLDLLCTIAEGHFSLQEIVDLAYDLFKNPIHITDMSRNVLVHSNTAKIQNKYWLRHVAQSEGIKETPQQVQEVRFIHNESIRRRLPLYVDDDAVPFPRIIKTLLNSQDHPIGVLILSEINRPLTPLDGQHLELLSTYIVRQAEKERFILQADERQAENFIIKLLEGTINTDKQIQSWLNYLNWSPKPSRYVVVFEDDHSEMERESAETVIETLKQLPHSRTVIYDTRVVLVLSRENPVGHWEEEERELMQKAAEWNMIMGVSREISTLCDVREAYLEAKTALRIGNAMGVESVIYDYTRYSLYHLLETLPKGVDLRRFCHDKVLRLEWMDKSADKELLTTLLCYLNNAKSLTRTAEMMFIHRNTVRYRINKCIEIMQTDFESGDEIFDILLSLRILKNLHLFR